MVKSNKLFKILAIALVVFCIVGIASNVFAQTDDLVDTFTSITPSSPDGFSADTFTNVTNNVMYIIQAVGIIAGIVIIAYMGIKYITSSPDGKAEIKKQAAIYILGAAFLMLAPTIAAMIFNAVKQSS